MTDNKVLYGNARRILMISPEPFMEPRGTPFSVYNRVKALLAMGYEVDLVTYPIGEQVSLPGLHIYRTPSVPFIRKVKIGPSLAKVPLDMLLFFTAFWRLCLRRYRFLHTHEEAGLMGVVLALLFDCKHLYDMHSDLGQQMSNFGVTKNPLLIGCVKAIQKLIVCRADAVIAICPDLEIAEMVRFRGQRPLTEMPQYMALANILLSPRSGGTNTPLKLYTYLRTGKPILATAILSHTQILTPDVAALVAPTPEGLAQGAIDLLQHREKARRLAEHGRQVAEAHYSWPAFLEKNRQAYTSFTSIIS